MPCEEVRTTDRGAAPRGSDEYREAYVDLGGHDDVQVEEYPGGDMTIYTKTDEVLYLSSEQAGALRTALGRIDASKRGDSSGE